LRSAIFEVGHHLADVMEGFPTGHTVQYDGLRLDRAQICALSSMYLVVSKINTSPIEGAVHDHHSAIGPR
jgi:hypothetical protein